MKNLATMAGFKYDLMMLSDSGLLFLGHPVFVSRSAAFSVKYLDLYYKYEIPATEGSIDVAHC